METFNPNRWPDPPDWFNLPFTPCESNGVSIGHHKGGFALHGPDSVHIGIWMGTSWACIAELLSQVDAARGRVLCTGLGLGLVPMLAAMKDDVDSVTVIENDPDVIALFDRQGFVVPKLSIVLGDADTHADGPYDAVLLDHYNGYAVMGAREIAAAAAKVLRNTGSTMAVPFRWTEFPDHDWSALGMPAWSSQELTTYCDAYNLAVGRIPAVVADLKKIEASRCTSS